MPQRVLWDGQINKHLRRESLYSVPDLDKECNPVTGIKKNG